MPRIRIAICIAALALSVVTGACKKKSPAIDKAKLALLLRDIPGLDSIPREARLVLSADVTALKKSVLVKRMVRQMLLRDPGLRTEFDKLSETCEFDIEKDLNHVVIGMGEEHVVAIATGRFIQSDIASCLNRDARASGGTFTAKEVGGHSYWFVENRGYKRWLAVPVSNTLVVATSEQWLTRTLGKRSSVLENPAMARLIGEVKHTANVWGVSQVPRRIGANLTRITGGQVKNPPKALRFTLELRGGLAFRLDALMASKQDAKSVSIFIDLTLKLAKRWNLDKLAAKVKTTVTGRAVSIRLGIDLQELKRTLSLIDRKRPHTQDKRGSEPRN